jgi:glutamyl-tRNA(Gln) amidotransferase subunit E
MRCGIEIHQRLAGKKLFCNCVPAEGQEETQVHLSRYLHPVKSELGEMDAAVRLESIRSRHIAYAAPVSSSCLVEADEEPPHCLNQEALHTAISFCSLVGANVVEELHLMRKNVIDGSNTSGFQRTAIVGIGGSVQTPSGKLGLQTICLEEESAGILEGGAQGSSSYELSRLGIPLIEIATEPTLKSGKSAQEAALALGSLLRKTGAVARGIGSIRQDLNISIDGGSRVEIKGVQSLEMVEKTVELEAFRQQQLLSISKELSSLLKGRQIEETFVELTEIFSSTSSQMVTKAIAGGSQAFGMLLPLHSGFLGREVSPGRRYGSELADYARSVGLKGLLHSDEQLEKYGISEDEISEIKVALGASQKDAFVLVLSDQKRAFAALSEVCRRANFTGVPGETRKANPEGTSSYMRPLPGSARMYPETDIPPIPITEEMLSNASQNVKNILASEKGKLHLLSSLNSELASQLSEAKGLLSHSPTFPLSHPTPELSAFAAAVEAGVEPKFAASTITNTLQSLKREGMETKKLDEQKLLQALFLFKGSHITKSAVSEVLREMCRDPSTTAMEAAKKLGVERIAGAHLKALIEKEKPDMKALMSKYRLQVDASEAAELMNKKN